MSIIEEFSSSRPWDLSYQKAIEAKPSWAKHGMPYLTEEFFRLVKENRVEGIHLDIGCGNGVKTVNYALAGFPTAGVDLSGECFRDGWQQIKGLDISKRCRLIRGTALALPVRSNLASSTSDVLCFTHIRSEEYGVYMDEVCRVLKNGGYSLMVLFSDYDKHFHGHPVSKHYTFHFDPQNPSMAGYSHYEGIYNVHFSGADIARIFQDRFEIVNTVEVPHPVYDYRKLWNVILRKRS